MEEIKKIKAVLERKTCKVSKEKQKISFKNNKNETGGFHNNFNKLVEMGNGILRFLINLITLYNNSQE